MSGQILLIRHTEVALHWKHRCYGRSDVGLSRTGREHAHELARTLARKPISVLIHSGLRRTAYLAERLATLSRLEPLIDTSWQERDFGEWEGRTWNAIWRETGSAMDGMLASPHTFRPGGGETTGELAARALGAWHALPEDGLIAVITHGGPIAVISAALARAPLQHLARYRVVEGSIVPIPFRARAVIARASASRKNAAC